VCILEHQVKLHKGGEGGDKRVGIDFFEI